MECTADCDDSGNPAAGLFELGSERLRSALAYWDAKRGSRPMPGRRDLDPIEIPRLLPFVLLIDVAQHPLDFRYRLIGTQVVAISGADHTGAWLSQLPGKGPGSVVWDNCVETVRRRRPFSRLPPYVGPARIRCIGNLLMPLSEDGCAVTMILQVVDFARA